MDESLTSQIVAYHEATKHHFHAYAPGPGYLDWVTQPDPFRRYAGATVIPLARIAPGDAPDYGAGFMPGRVPPAALDFESVSRLFFDTLALSAWKEYGGNRWALRVNPSSGNLHPTEGYLICGAVPGLWETPMVAHYAPAEHALEVRARLSDRTWQDLREGVALHAGDGLPLETLFFGLTSIHWREAWKYGERAFRYCQHDAGHALAALGIAAMGLGWEARLLDNLGTDQVGTLLGVTDPRDVEPEHPDCLVAVYPHRRGVSPVEAAGERPGHLPAAGVAGPAQHAEPRARRVAVAERCGRNHTRSRRRSRGQGAGIRSQASGIRGQRSGVRSRGSEWRMDGGCSPNHLRSLRRIIHQRRSAVEMDGRTGDRRGRRSTASCCTRCRGPGDAPFAMLPWSPHVHLAIFVHRVAGLEPGLYFLVRDPAQTDALVAALKPDFAWAAAAPSGCPPELPLYRLATGDMRTVAQRISCGQDIAADGCFSLGMLAEFERPLTEHGAWFYPRLFWECGMIGQVLYLEAEAAGVRGTGIGCFFDDGMHSLLGLAGRQYQSLYHFTVGGPVEDPRLTTLPAYA